VSAVVLSLLFRLLAFVIVFDALFRAVLLLVVVSAVILSLRPPHTNTACPVASVGLRSLAAITQRTIRRNGPLCVCVRVCVRVCV
jgi:hypothetical protein